MLNMSPEFFRISISDKFYFRYSLIAKIPEFGPNSDLKSSNGSVPRRSNLSTKVGGGRRTARTSTDSPASARAEAPGFWEYTRELPAPSVLQNQIVLQMSNRTCC